MKTSGWQESMAMSASIITSRPRLYPDKKEMKYMCVNIYIAVHLHMYSLGLAILGSLLAIIKCVLHS